MTTWPAPVYVKAAIHDALLETMKDFDVEACVAAWKAVDIGTREAIRKHMEEQKNGPTAD